MQEELRKKRVASTALAGGLFVFALKVARAHLRKELPEVTITIHVEPSEE